MLRKITQILPHIFVFAFVILNREGKDILAGIFVLFPLLYIFLGARCNDLKTELIPSFIALTLTFLIPINLLYNMGNCLDLALIYNILGIISFHTCKAIKNRRRRR